MHHGNERGRGLWKAEAHPGAADVAVHEGDAVTD